MIAKILCTAGLPQPVIELPVVKLLPLFSLAMLGPPGSLLTITSPAVSRLELSPAAVLSLVWSLEAACEQPPDAWEALLPPSSTPPETHTGFYSHAAFLLRQRANTQIVIESPNTAKLSMFDFASYTELRTVYQSVLINSFTCCYSFHMNYFLSEAKQDE